MISSTSMSRPQGGSQTVLFGLPIAENDLSPLEDLMQALTASEGSVVTEAQRTASKFEQFKVVMQANMTALADKNRVLQEQFTALESRQKEMTVLHKEQLAAARAEVDGARQEVAVVRLEMLAVAQRADERVAAEITAKNEAVRAATQTGEELIVEARQEAEAVRQELQRFREEAARQAIAAEAAKNAAVLAAIHRVEVLAAAASAEAAITRQTEAVRARELLAETTLQAYDTLRMRECYHEIGSNEQLAKRLRSHGCTLCGGECAMCRNFSVQLQALGVLIEERARRAIDLVTNAAQQRVDTQKMQLVSTGITSIADHHLPTSYPTFAPLRQYVLGAKIKIDALIRERSSRN